MNVTLADRTDWRSGFGNAVPLTNPEVGQYVRKLSEGGNAVSLRSPMIIGIAGTGSLFVNAMLLSLTHSETAARSTKWPAPFDTSSQPINVGETAAQQLAQELRRLSGLTNEEIAPLAGVSRRSFQAWLAGGSISARKETRLRQLVEAMASIGEADSHAMRSRLLRKRQGSVRLYDLLAEGRFSAVLELTTGSRPSPAKLRARQEEAVAQQFDRDQGSLPDSGGRLNRSLSKPLRR